GPTAAARAAAAGHAAPWAATSGRSMTASRGCGWARARVPGGPGFPPPVSRAASSWAANLAVVYAARRPASLAGLLLLGPVLTAEVKLSPARQLQVVVGHLVAPTAYLPIPLTPELYTA